MDPNDQQPAQFGGSLLEQKAVVAVGDMCFEGSMKYLSSIFMVFSIGCSSATIMPDAFDHCVVDRSSSWQLVDMDAPLQEALLGVSYKDKTIREHMTMESEHPIVDVWFANPKGEFQFCRYENIPDSCSSNEKSALFRLVDGVYHGYQIVEKVCLIHNVANNEPDQARQAVP